MRTIFLVITLCCTTVLAQHQHPQAVIDGKDHPELIPDALAYRLYFAANSPSDKDTEIDTARKAGMVHLLRLHPDDEKVFTSSMTSFGAQYRGLIKGYNAEATAAWKTGKVDPQLQQQFLLRRDQLLETTVAGLKANLSFNGWLQLSTIIQGEKRNMKLQGGAQ